MWISGYNNKAADCLSWLVDVKDTSATTTASINMLVTSTPDGPSTHTCSKTCNSTDTTSTDTTPKSTNDKVITPKHLAADQKDTFETHAEDGSLL